MRMISVTNDLISCSIALGMSDFFTGHIR
jgi:hypothetical protein